VGGSETKAWLVKTTDIKKKEVKETNIWNFSDV
jgi:hypothetical protein